MKPMTLLVDQVCGAKLSALAVIVAALAALPVSAQSDENDDRSVSQAQILADFEAARDAGRNTEAARYALEYVEMSEGENTPLAVTLTHRYGILLHEDGDVPEAIAILKQARERGRITFGEHGIELFEINLDLGDVYVDREMGIGRPRKYFDDALEVLRENGKHESVLYVRTLVGIASRLTQAGALDGALSADAGGVNLRGPGGSNTENLINTGMSSLTQSYQSGYRVLDGYIREAVELAEVLGIEDPYLSAKVAIVQSKIKVTETVFLEIVPTNVRGSVSGAQISDRYQREDNNLSLAIEVLRQDVEQNEAFLSIANSTRMDIAWLSEDMERLAGFCSGDALDMASRYPPERLYEIEDDGSVIAPSFSFRISGNIFEQLEASRFDSGGLNRKRSRDNKPSFVPVCINGRLMALLINAPKVTIEDFESIEDAE